MKIPKKDGATCDPSYRGTDKWEDILCDKCGKSCRDDEDMNFEYASVKATWGYCSKKDLTEHEAQICEPCYDSLGLKPKVTRYM